MKPFLPSIYIFVIILSGGLSAAPRPSSLFTDNAVLQRDRVVPIWGMAEVGEHITIQYRDESVSTTADGAGVWRAELPAMAVGEASPLVFIGEGRYVSQNVIVGDVWLCAGQSNMEWPVSRSDLMSSRNRANYPQIRQFKVKASASERPLIDVDGRWVVCSPQNVPQFSAIGYAFVRSLYDSLHVPQGILNSSWGGSPIEAWLSDEVIDRAPRFHIVRERWLEYLDQEYPTKFAAYQKSLAEWKEQGGSSGSSEKPPREPNGPLSRRTVSGAYNAMLMPLVPYALRGVVWYQGESNTGRPSEYGPMLKAMIKDWRACWQQEALPFVLVQLPNYASGAPNGVNWAQLRAQQATALELPNTALVVTIDAGDPDNIHPTTKEVVGQRIARLALAEFYGSFGLFRNLEPIEAQLDGDRVLISFNTAADGIELKDQDPGAIAFELAGKDRKFFSAKARQLLGGVIVVSSKVPNPCFVRYCWRNAPQAILYNQAGMPAAPFEMIVKP